MATQKMKGFKVKVVGEYYARSEVMGEKRVVKNYEFEANIPVLTAALSTVKNKLLTPVLKKKHKDYIMYRTYHITEITPLDETSRQQMKKVEIAYMDRASLVEYIQENALPVESRLYPNLFDLRIAVQDAKTDPDAYLKKLALRRADLEMELQIADLNPGLHDEPETPASVSIANKFEKETGPSGQQPAKKITPAKINQQAEERVAGLNKDMQETGEHVPMDPEAEKIADAQVQKELDDI